MITTEADDSETLGLSGSGTDSLATTFAASNDNKNANSRLNITASFVAVSLSPDVLRPVLFNSYILMLFISQIENGHITSFERLF
jgi:hypothetical protein